MTRERLAELADISVQFLADIEKVKKNMTVTTLRKLSDALSVSTDYLVNGIGEPVSQELMLLYNRLSKDKQAYALPIMRIFENAVRE